MKELQGLYLHFDPVSGIAGDMTVAALVDAGVPQRVVVDAVAALGVPGLRVGFEARRRGAFLGKGFIVNEPGRRPRPAAQHPIPVRQAHEDHHGHGHEHAHEHGHEHEHGRSPGPAYAHPHARDPSPRIRRQRPSTAASSKNAPSVTKGAPHHHRDYADIRALVARAKLPGDTKDLAQEMFATLAKVEGALHDMPVDRVAFHEVGAFDSIADIVGMSAAITWLAPSAIGSSPPVVGTGMVRTAHGLVPVPAPATAALLRGVPMIADGEGELTTPTGAVLLATVVDSFGPPPPLRVTAIGYGAGTRELADRANVLRVMLGAPIGRALPAASEEVLVLESNIDDMTGQLLASLADALFAAGALDVWSTPILMKKGRPAQQISALAEPSALADVERAFFLNSTTLGIRIHPVSRRTLARSLVQVPTAFGSLAVKVAALDGTAISSSPEYEDCRRAAARAQVPVRKVWMAAVEASSGISTPGLPSAAAKTAAVTAAMTGAVTAAAPSAAAKRKPVMARKRRVRRS